MKLKHFLMGIVILIVLGIMYVAIDYIIYRKSTMNENVRVIERFRNDSLLSSKDTYMQIDTDHNEIINVNTENSEMIDQSININFRGLQPGKSAIIRATSKDDIGALWQSYAVFRVDQNGCIALESQKPLAGTYSKIDPMGLFWSMLPITDSNDFLFVKRNLDPMQVVISIEIDGKLVASKMVNREILASNIKSININENGIVGNFFTDKNRSKRNPCIIVLSGSDGGRYEHVAALLASHGFSTLALSYWGEEGLPQNLSEIPLEYFNKAIQWLKTQDTVDTSNIGVLGYSMGGDLALLLGSLFPEINSVVAYTCSGYVWQGLEGEGLNRKQSSSWTKNGKQLNFIPYKLKLPILTRFSIDQILRKPMKMLPMYQSILKSDSIVLQNAEINVANIKGSILLFSGENDMNWPSTSNSNQIIARLKSAKFPHYYNHFSYKGASHMLLFPYRPTLMVDEKHEFVYGGDPEAAYLAGVDSWEKTIMFFKNDFKSISKYS